MRASNPPVTNCCSLYALPVWFIPSQEVVLESPLSAEQAEEQLANLIEPTRWPRWEGGKDKFQGVLSERRLKVSRIIGYRNSFLPVVVGEIVPAPGGSEMRLTFRLNRLSAVFGLIFLFVIISTDLTVLHSLMARHALTLAAFAPSGIVAAIYGILMLAFRYETRRAMRILSTAVQALQRIPESQTP